MRVSCVSIVIGAVVIFSCLLVPDNIPSYLVRSPPCRHCCHYPVTRVAYPLPGRRARCTQVTARRRRLPASPTQTARTCMWTPTCGWTERGAGLALTFMGQAACRGQAHTRAPCLAPAGSSWLTFRSSIFCCMCLCVVYVAWCVLVLSSFSARVCNFARCREFIVSSSVRY